MRKAFFYVLLLLVVQFACRPYRQQVMLRPAEFAAFADASAAMESHNKHLIIAPFDRLRLRVYTNAGEMIIDPNFQLMREMGGGGMGNMQMRQEQDFLVLDDGTVKVPLLGHVDLNGLTIDQAERKLQHAYDEYYEDSYVILRYLNKRVVLLGGPAPQVVTLENENMNLMEILALGGGLDQASRSYNIRLVRGPVDNPEIFLIDLSTIEGMKQSLLTVEAGDVIYVEQQRRMFSETARDISVAAGLLFNIITIILVLNNL